MPDPTEAHARRGAHWTFNAQSFVTAIHKLKNNGGWFATDRQNDSGLRLPAAVIEIDVQDLSFLMLFAVDISPAKQ